MMAPQKTAKLKSSVLVNTQNLDLLKVGNSLKVQNEGLFASLKNAQILNVVHLFSISKLNDHNTKILLSKVLKHLSECFSLMALKKISLHNFCRN